MSEQPNNPDPGDRFANPGPGDFANHPTNQPVNDPVDEATAEFMDGSMFDGEIVDAEIVDDEPPKPGKAVVLRRAGSVTVRGTATVIATARTVATHPHTRRTARAVVRHGWHPIAGAGVLVKRWRDAHGASRYERLMTQAELSGNHEMLLEWENRDVTEKQRRHDRVMDWIRSPLDLLRAIAVGFAATTMLLLGLGIVLALANKDVAMVIGPIVGVINAIAFTVWFLSVYGATLLTTVTVGFVVYLWHTGRVQATAPGWLRSEAERGDEMGALVTADAIVAALRHLPISAMKNAFKEGWVPRFELTPTREGQGAFRGFRAIFDLPMSVTPKMIADLREVLAKNLHRNAVEVWPADYGREKGGKAGYVNLYVADSGVMDKPTPPYPLLNDGTADVFEGVPIGITQRGDVVRMPVVGSNSVFGGQPGQGKSNAVRVAVAGVALDPVAEIRMHVFALNGDFDAYTRRLSRYEKGATAEHVASAAQHLQELYDEVGRREGRLAELGAKKLTRTIAEQHPDLRPMLVGFSECHEMFSHAEHGKLAAELAIAVVKRGRKTGVSLVFDTQSARTNAIPSQLVENVGFNGCFAVKAWRSNDGFLGDGSFAAGIRATDLRFNVDRGTMVATGASEELFEIVRTFFIEVDDDAGWDQATEIIDRAMAQLATGTPVNSDRPALRVVEVERDLLDDLDEVLPDTGRIPAGDVLGALRNLAPKWKPYTEFTVPTLVAALGELGIKVPRTGNKYPVDPVTVREVLAQRDRAVGEE
jgi:S-DNA-T family DNA segregation ATPase FtsK/SpoIIIE